MVCRVKHIIFENIENDEGGQEGGGKELSFFFSDNEKRIVKDKRNFFEKMYLFTHEKARTNKGKGGKA